MNLDPREEPSNLFDRNCLAPAGSGGRYCAGGRPSGARPRPGLSGWGGRPGKRHRAPETELNASNIEPMELSPNVARLRPSATIAVSTLARKLKGEGRDILDLSAGEPDFPTPTWISEAAIEGIRAGQTRYTPASGLPELRDAVARELLEGAAPGWELDAGNVVVTSGAKQALFNACFALFGPDDEVLVAAPYWTSYPEIVGLARAESVFVAGPEERGFLLTPADLDRVVTPRTRGLIICTPSNPSGAVYSREDLAGIARWARDRDVCLISDEIYRQIHFGNGEPAPGLLNIDCADVGPYVIIDGVSKSCAMTGWRIGYSVSDSELASKLGALQSHTTSNAATPSQVAALAALRGGERTHAEIRTMVKAFRRRRDLVVARVRERLPHLSFIEPEGAFYLFLRVDGEYGNGVPDSTAWCSRVLETTGVAMVPGAAFGDDRYVRLSYATSDDILEEAIRRLAEDRG
jgi:aspartate aminotransferase